ncbi:MAG: GumC family protein [Gemmatimonadaceae bacterium]
MPATPFAGSVPVPVGPSDIVPYDGGHDRSGEEEGSGDLGAKIRRYVAAIKRFRWLVIGLAAAGTIAGVIATRYIDPVFEARGALWISDVGNTGGAYRPPELLPNGAWVQLVKSFAVVDQVVANQRLFLTPKSWQDSVALAGLMPTRRTAAGQYTLVVDPAGTKFTLSELTRGVVDRGTLGDSVGRPVGFAWAPTNASLQGRHNVQFGVVQPRTVSVGLINRLDVGMQENSNFLTLSLSGPDKWQTADLLNAWMQQFVTTAADLRRRNMSAQAAILETQKVSTQAELTQAENALQGFRSGAITKPTEGAVAAPQGVPGATAAPLGLASDYYRAQADYQDVRRNRETLEKIIADARRGVLSADALVAVPVVANAPSLGTAVKELVDKEAQLRALKLSYTDAFKPVKDLTASIQTLRTQTIPDLAAVQVGLLKARESQITQQVQANASDLRSIPARNTEEGRLRRNLTTSENLYNNVEGRYETAKLGAESTVPDVSILDPALPAAGAQRNIKVLLVLGGFVAAAALGILIALLLDMLDRRFRYPEQIADDLGLRVLGAIPTIPKPEDAEKDPEAMLQSVEAFRGLRMNLHHAFDAPPVMVTISSPGVGDGKSMVSSNLALSFAEAGFRTLLIDGDIRRGKLHSVFGLDRRPGLLDYLAGDVDIARIMREVPVHGSLTLIPSGTRRHRGPELLTSARLTTLLDTVRPRFDVILVDSAPLAAGVDAYALGVATQNLMLVMRTGHTDRRVAKAKLKLLERLPVRILGAVVNAVPDSDVYAEYSYLYGYGADADSDITATGDEIGVLSAPAERQG